MNCRPAVASDFGDVLGLGALGSRLYFEFYCVPFGQRTETVALDAGVMDEDVLSTILLNEAEALLIVEPLDHATRHMLLLRYAFPVTLSLRQTPPGKPVSGGCEDLTPPKSTFGPIRAPRPPQ